MRFSPAFLRPYLNASCRIFCSFFLLSIDILRLMPCVNVMCLSDVDMFSTVFQFGSFWRRFRVISRSVRTNRNVCNLFYLPRCLRHNNPGCCMAYIIGCADISDICSSRHGTDFGLVNCRRSSPASENQADNCHNRQTISGID
jgi:hypothetical protein